MWLPLQVAKPNAKPGGALVQVEILERSSVEGLCTFRYRNVKRIFPYDARKELPPLVY